MTGAGRGQLAQASKSKRGGKPGSAKRNLFPWINGQIISVSNTGDLAGLVSTIEAHLQQMNLVNISTALHRLAKMAASDPKTQMELAHHPVVEALLNHARSALGRATSGANPPSSQALSNISWALATLQRVDVLLLQAVAGPSAAFVSHFKTFELSAILWAFAKTGKMDQHVAWCARPLFEAAVPHIVQNLREFSFRCLVTVVWAFATARHHAPEVFNLSASVMVGTVHTANCQELSNLVWAFATANCPHEKLFAALSKKALARLSEFKPQDLANTLWGFAAAGYCSEGLFVAAAQASQRMELHAQHLAAILWALTRARARSPALSESVLRLLPECEKRVWTFTPQDLSVVLLAAAKAYGHSAERDRGEVSAAAVAAFFAAASPWVRPRLRDFSGRSLAYTAVSFLAVEADGAQVLLPEIGHQVLLRKRELGPTELLYCISAFTTDMSRWRPGARDAPHWRTAQALFGEAARMVDNFKPRHLEILSRVCAKLAALGEVLSRGEGAQLSVAELRARCLALSRGPPPPAGLPPAGLLSMLNSHDTEVCLDDEHAGSPGSAVEAATHKPSWQPPFRTTHPSELHAPMSLTAPAPMVAPISLSQSAWASALALGGAGAQLATGPGAVSMVAAGCVATPFGAAPLQAPASRGAPPAAVRDSSSSGSASSAAAGAPRAAAEGDEREETDEDRQHILEGYSLAPLSPEPEQSGAEGGGPLGGRYPDSRRLAGRRSNKCPIKNTFLHFEDEEALEDGAEDDARFDSGSPGIADALGPPLAFLPKYIEPGELQAYRADYQAFRAGQATGARGEISQLGPSTHELEALGLHASSEAVAAASSAAHAATAAYRERGADAMRVAAAG